MSRIAPRHYQREAVAQTLEIFRHAEGQIRVAADAAGRRVASAYNGCVLLEAPTGAGKTLMAGLIAEAFSRTDRDDNARIIWFWFTPFKGLVEQARSALKQDFSGLRMRNLHIDRSARTARSGDVFVTTWAAVAANNAETRQVRRGGDVAVALDDFIAQLRQDGFRIGAVVDEAHHTFFKSGTEAGRFYGAVLCPDYTLMVTATPNDRDVERFKQVSGVIEVHRNTVSRCSAVDAGLIKAGVQAVAFLADPAQAAIINFAETALREAWAQHQQIKQALCDAGIELTPLLLVQVGNHDQAVAEAKLLLTGLGIPDERIASYTAKEPTNDLLAVALDERYEVLIFKVAVALGFDAPRAFVLASLRSAKDSDFGIQVVGRILRVHRRLQPGTLDRTLPPNLNYGYVFLADAEKQTGLVNAGARINAIRDELAQICPATTVFRVGNETQIQITATGQGNLLWGTDAPELPDAADQDPQQLRAKPTAPVDRSERVPLALDLRPSLFTAERTRTTGRHTSVTPGMAQYFFRTDAERRLKTERMAIATAELLSCIAARIGFDDAVINAGLRTNVNLTRKTLGVFDRSETFDEAQTRLEAKALAQQAQMSLLHHGYLDVRELYLALRRRLHTEFWHRGLDHDATSLNRALNLILAQHPALLRRAERQCASEFKEVIETGAWPETLEAALNAERSRRNVYGVMPDGLNSLELMFARLLDADLSGAVEYWYRNEPRKPWSVAIVLPSGAQFFPDFVLKVKGRCRGAGFLLVETKGNHILHSRETIEKVNAEHRLYGSALFLKQGAQGRLMTVRYIENADHCDEDQVFRLENLMGY